MKEDKGIDELEEIIKKMFFKGDISFNDEVIITKSIGTIYLPIQNFEKISFTRSSPTSSPIILPII